MWALIAFSLSGTPQHLVPAQIVQNFINRADCEQALDELSLPDHVLRRYRFACVVRG